MHRRKLVTAAVVAGSVAAGMVVGAVVFTPGVGLAADSEIGRDVAAVCEGVLGAGPLFVAAEAIGIEPSELAAELRDGKTIAEVAQDQGVEPSTVVDALVSEWRDRLDRGVQDGLLTQEQADERAADLEERATDLVNGDLPLASWGAMPPMPWGHPGLWGFADGPIAAAADVIGLAPEDLLAELRDGKTVAEVAQEHGVEVPAVVDAVDDALQERLDAAVANGWITEQEADERAANLEEQATAIVNGNLGPFPILGPWMRGGPGMFGPGMFGPGHGGTDADSTAASAS
jgi:transposase-like protein